MDICSVLTLVTLRVPFSRILISRPNSVSLNVTTPGKSSFPSLSKCACPLPQFCHDNIFPSPSLESELTWRPRHPESFATVYPMSPKPPPQLLRESLVYSYLLGVKPPPASTVWSSFCFPLRTRASWLTTSQNPEQPRLLFPLPAIHAPPSRFVRMLDYFYCLPPPPPPFSFFIESHPSTRTGAQ